MIHPLLRLAPALLTLASATAQVRIESGSLDGAAYALAIPADWNGKLLVEAHGLRPPDAPLVAEIQPRTPFNRDLLARGWMLATTSYRRNGLIVADALDDLRTLRDHIAATHGNPTRTLVEGSSLGGLIGTLLAERGEPGFDGVIALGAALDARDPAAPDLAPVGPPRIPLLFVSNLFEADGPRAYTARHAAAHPAPVLRTVDRPGHVNLNAAERLDAVAALERWLDNGTPPEPGDATRPANPGPSTARFIDGAAVGTVTDLSRLYGNLVTDLQPADLEHVGIRHGTRFVLDAPLGRFDVLWGDSYGDVPRGGWVAFTTADGTLMLARNYANAAETAGLSASSEVRVAPAPAP